ncbi:gliding motility-associated C-terminal domain-containing protein [Bacteroidota bacterium]
MKEKQTFEQLVKSKLEKAEVTPSQGIWEQTARSLHRRSFWKFNKGRFNIYYGIGIVGILAILTPSISDYFSENILKNKDLKLKDSAVLSNESTDNNNKTQGTGDEENINEIKRTNKEKNNQANLQDVEKERKENTDAENNTDLSNTMTLSIDNAPKIDTGIEEHAENMELVTMVPNFIPSVHEGCAPLTVTFKNTSVNAYSFTWDYGTSAEEGTSMKTQNLQEQRFTYYEPGIYNVTLTALSGNGTQISHSEQIVVRPKPIADFEIEQKGIYNYSQNASDYQWSTLLSNLEEEAETKHLSMLDKKVISTAFQPQEQTLDFNAKEASHLMLTAKNEYGCMDTVVREMPQPEKPSLNFPNAFTPNPNGATGGYYNMNEPNNQVFYPISTEKPATYQLTVFNRLGEIVFESNSLEIGWDGYNNQTPAKQAVYVYICKGSWSNGDPFVYKGDITLLWGN